jgi:tRNA pseudouridine38-40 synthase
MTDSGTIRLRFDVAYDGTDFVGWARQPGQRTVQGVLELALGTILRQHPVPSLTVAGRTDSGVHAAGQVAHADVSSSGQDLVVESSVARFTRRLQGVLPPDVAVRRVSRAPTGFDARFSALDRRYTYRIADPETDSVPLRRREVLRWPRWLDVAAMDQAGIALLGEHDFAAYCRRREGATTVRRLMELRCRREESGAIAVSVIADAFCHSMVRSLVGALLAVGEGRRPVEWPGVVLSGEVRDSAVNVVAPHGLTLEEVRYPPDDQLLARAFHTRRRRVAETPTP